MIFLQRPYMESIVREANKSRDMFQRFVPYLANIRAYDEFLGRKIRVTYSEIIDPELGGVKRVMDFLGLDYNLEGFDVDAERKKSLDWYDQGQHRLGDRGRGTMSRDDLHNPEYHSGEIDETTRGAVERFCRITLGANLFEKYCED